MTGETAPALGDFQPGARISSYRIDQLIGRGGMAVVYRATDVRLDRLVALKVLSPELARDEAFRQRFIRESRAGAAVDHPNVIPVFEAGEADGVLFIAMRYVAGHDVRSLIEREGRLPAARAVNIVTQVASALDAAHARGLIHRDVKPANMLLAAVGDAVTPDYVYLSDFGLSKQSVSAASLTGTGQLLGTVDYMSPEQVEGRPVDGRTDLYALACAAFELLAGEPPFRREQELAVMWAQVSAPPPSIRRFRPELSAEADHVFGRALAKASADRHASCTEFALALRAACAIRPAPAAPGQARVGAGVGALGVDEPETDTAVPAVGAPAAGGAVGTPQIVGVPMAVGGPPTTDFDSPAYYGGGWPRGTPGQPGPPGALGPMERPWNPASYPPPVPPRRSKLLPVLVSLLVILILAGAAVLVLRLLHKNNPISGPTPPARNTSHSAQSNSPSPSQASPTTSQNSPGAPQSGPVAVVEAYFNAINSHQYRQAWNLNASAHSKGFATFEQGYSNTQYDTVQIVSVSNNVVTIHLTALHTDGTDHYFMGTYTVQNGEIVDSNIQPASH